MHTPTKVRTIGILLLMFLSATGVAADALHDGFISPPASARPWVLWYWMDGQINREGITKDLEAMARNGIGGVVLGDIGGTDEGPTKFLSPGWQELFAHTLREAKRLGLVVSTCPSAGWCALGGPWIEPEDSMQVLVWSTTRVRGPRRFAAAIPKPQTVESYYRDVAVLAFPSPAEPLTALERITTSPGKKNAALLVDGNPETAVTFRIGPKDEPHVIDLQFKRPVKVRGVALEFTDLRRLGDMRLEMGGADGALRQVGNFSGKTGGAMGIVFRAVADVQPSTTERVRIVLSGSGGVSLAAIGEIEVFGENYIPGWTAKSGAEVDGREITSDNPGPRGRKAASIKSQLKAKTEGSQEPREGISNSSLLDLTGKMLTDGKLDWQIPEGEWVIMRFGHTSRGAKNRPAKEGEGLESDKFRPEVTKFHFEQYIGMMARKYPEYMGSTFVAMWQDSWETGAQNWSAGFIDEFKLRRGYDPLPYLPAMTGRVVGTASESERFLWDIRRTVADLSADNYLGALTQLGKAYGIGLWFQPINRHFLDGMQGVGRATGAEANMHFSQRDRAKREYAREKFCASAAHGYGQVVVHSEAATAAAPTGAFVSTPASIRELVNANFCTGMNNHWIHVFLHQPWQRAEPGLSWRWGLQFQRNNTWFEKLGAWSTYVTRGQYMLRQGLPVVDIVAFIGESVPSEGGQFGTIKELNGLPAGIDYDVCNAEIILTRMSVKNGRIVLPDGMNYALLYLPTNVAAVRPAVFRKIRDLVRAGATLVGNPPSASPSLENYPACDMEIKQLADELWAKNAAEAQGGRRVGAGLVFAAASLERALAAGDMVEDFSLASAQPEPRIEYYHRRTADTDIYFVANRLPRAEEAVCIFRVDGRAPELWQPDTGVCETTALFKSENGRTKLPLRLPPFGSVFVVFRASSAAEDPIVSVTVDGCTLLDAAAKPPLPGAIPTIFESVRPNASGPIMIRSSENGSFSLILASGKSENVVITSADAPITVAGSWEVSFPAERGAPERVNFESLIPWNTHTSLGVKYFSGTATYHKAVQLPASAFTPGKRLYLDLGDVREVAQVKVNGNNLGILWKTPFRVEITGTARAGDNELAIEVVNLWVNRMIGDECMYPDDVEWTPESQGEWHGFGMRKGLPAWFKAWDAGHGERPTGRVAFSTVKFHSAKDPLLPSGLIGPVRILTVAEMPLRSNRK